MVATNRESGDSTKCYQFKHTPSMIAIFVWFTTTKSSSSTSKTTIKLSSNQRDESRKKKRERESSMNVSARVNLRDFAEKINKETDYRRF